MAGKRAIGGTVIYDDMPIEEAAKRATLTVEGPPLTDELRQLFAPFGRGFPLVGVMVMPGDQPFIIATYDGSGIQFSVRFFDDYPTTT